MLIVFGRLGQSFPDSPLDAAWLFLALIAVGITLYLLSSIIYNLYLHPLAHIPGPRLAATSQLPWLIALWRGRLHLQLLAWHERYGTIVRTGPNELSVTDPQAWKDIYGIKQSKVFKKDRFAVATPVAGAKGLVAADGDDHARQRRLMSHAFSERAMRQQEELVSVHAQNAREKLLALTCAPPTASGEADTSNPGSALLNIVELFSHYTFDVLTDLAFGESSNCLRDPAQHHFVTLTGDSAMQQILMNLSRRLWIVRLFVPRFISPRALARKRMVFMTQANATLDRRLAKEKSEGQSGSTVEKGTGTGTAMQRPDLVGHILSHQSDTLRMSPGELRANTFSFITAGSESTASALTAITHYLAVFPQWQEKVYAEIVGALERDPRADTVVVGKLKYTQAFITECLRIHPPIPSPLIREAQVDAVVCGQVVPRETFISTSIYAAHHSARNFHCPQSFAPERWLSSDDEEACLEFANDNQDAFQPFSTGTRNCIAKNLAMMEIRLLLMTMIPVFRFELPCLESDGRGPWEPERAKTFLMWKRPEVWVRVARR
ncbi:cytochrome P450 [Aspergillus karnatakaensis]|uniref:cytochrome P450 n=1 Tax=Aspergillus karnatakaensis TaxID=1810916 RepID=UPI003CCD3A56